MYYTNNYRQNKSFRKRFSEDILYIIKWGFHLLLKGKKVKTVLFYPQYPQRYTVIYKVISALKYNITNNPLVKHHLAIYWDNTTYRKPDSTIIKMAEKERILNIKCIDISKTNVDSVFNEVFGYSCRVDSRTYSGLMVKKSEINASHDGIVVHGPTEPEKGFIYLKLINNEFNDHLVVDMRIPIVNGKMPLVYLKYKGKATRFAHYRKIELKRKKPEVHPVKSLLSQEEIDKITLFCQKMGLDYGEIDVLRDKDDQKLYIIDVNNTPHGPSVGKKLREESVKRIATVFKNEFF
jgi:hypothetical protein